MVIWLIIYCFTSCSRIFHSYGDITTAGEGLQNLGLCSVLRAFEQGGIFIVPHLNCDMGLRFIWSHLKDQQPHPTVGFDPTTQGSSFIKSLRHADGLIILVIRKNLCCAIKKNAVQSREWSIFFFTIANEIVLYQRTAKFYGGGGGTSK